MDAEDWEEFSKILDRRAVANSTFRFAAHMGNAVESLKHIIEQEIWNVLIKEKRE